MLIPFLSVEQAAEAVSNFLSDFSIILSDLSKGITMGGEGEANGRTSRHNSQIVTSFMERNPVEKKRKAPVLEPIEFPMHKTADDFIEIPPSPQAEGGTTQTADNIEPSSLVGAPSSSGAPTASIEMDFSNIDPDIANRGRELRDRFETLSRQCPNHGNVQIGFVEDSKFLEELQADIRKPKDICEQLLKEKEGIILYYEREFQLKEELTLHLFHREAKSKKKYRFQSNEEVRNAVDEFLSKKYVKRLSGFPSEVGLKDLEVEILMLKKIGKTYQLYKELETYFKGKEEFFPIPIY